MPSINPYQNQTMKSTTKANYGDERWDVSKMYPDDEGINSMPLNELQQKGYNATTDADKGSN